MFSLCWRQLHAKTITKRDYIEQRFHDAHVFRFAQVKLGHTCMKVEEATAQEEDETEATTVTAAQTLKELASVFDDKVEGTKGEEQPEQAESESEEVSLLG